MKNLLVAVVTTSVLALAAVSGCSSSDSSNNGGTVGGWCANQLANEDPEDKACNECMQAQCGAQMSECYGAGYASGNFGGSCGPVIQCQCSCAEGDLGCIVACGDKGGSACESCVAKIDSCEKSKCAAACGTSSTPDDPSDPGAPSAGGCANLETTCCPKIADAESKQTCDDVVAMKDDAVCDQAFESWKDFLCE